MVDDSDFGRLSGHAWFIQRGRHTMYASRNRKISDPKGWPKSILMHREIMNFPVRKEIDHKNKNGLDNRKQNLRICTRSQNARNTVLSVGASGKRGVSWAPHAKKWMAKIKIGPRQKYLGYFSNLEDASKAYKKAAEADYVSM